MINRFLFKRLDRLKFKMDIKKVIDDIEDMTKEHHIEIFKILTSYDIKYTENNNGIFINISSMNPECLKKINDYVFFINENNKKLIEFEQVKEDSILKLSVDETI
jgi:hypothetical protein